MYDTVSNGTICTHGLYIITDFSISVDSAFLETTTDKQSHGSFISSMPKQRLTTQIPMSTINSSILSSSDMTFSLQNDLSFSSPWFMAFICTVFLTVCISIAFSMILVTLCRKLKMKSSQVPNHCSLSVEAPQADSDYIEHDRLNIRGPSTTSAAARTNSMLSNDAYMCNTVFRVDDINENIYTVPASVQSREKNFMAMNSSLNPAYNVRSLKDNNYVFQK